ncbi:hypothetical protein NPIL_66881 [Nephila pilipes]|uniref:Uncharacterized protein n=1 Tax=Nephila pilipes TaxID=299642 RepID=A0A8X6TYD1_NEPPI|nr:hypothetical protein NPIL_66881 [Nephila pilipes]
MEMLNDSQNEMEFKDDSRSSISSISTSSIDTSSTCEGKQQIESNIQSYTRIRQNTKREPAQNFSIHNDYEHPEYKSLKNSIRLFIEETRGRKFLTTTSSERTNFGYKTKSKAVGYHTNEHLKLESQEKHHGSNEVIFVISKTALLRNIVKKTTINPINTCLNE